MHFMKRFMTISMSGSRGTAKSLKECESHYGISLYSKVHSPPYCCAVLLDPRLISKSQKKKHDLFDIFPEN